MFKASNARQQSNLAACSSTRAYFEGVKFERKVEDELSLEMKDGAFMFREIMVAQHTALTSHGSLRGLWGLSPGRLAQRIGTAIFWFMHFSWIKVRLLQLVI